MHFDQLIEGVRLSERNPKMVKSSARKNNFHKKELLSNVLNYTMKNTLFELGTIFIPDELV